MRQISLKICGQVINLKCAKEEEELICQSAQIFQNKIDEVRLQSNVADSNRAILIAALLLIFEQNKQQKDFAPSQTIEELISKIDDALHHTQFPAKVP